MRVALYARVSTESQQARGTPRAPWPLDDLRARRIYRASGVLPGTAYTSTCEPTITVRSRGRLTYSAQLDRGHEVGGRIHLDRALDPGGLDQPQHIGHVRLIHVAEPGADMGDPVIGVRRGTCCAGPFPRGPPPNPAGLFRGTRLSSDLRRVRGGLPVVDGVVARVADHEGLAPLHDHDCGPRRLVCSGLIELSESADRWSAGSATALCLARRDTSATSGGSGRAPKHRLAAGPGYCRVDVRADLPDVHTPNGTGYGGQADTPRHGEPGPGSHPAVHGDDCRWHHLHPAPHRGRPHLAGRRRELRGRLPLDRQPGRRGDAHHRAHLRPPTTSQCTGRPSGYLACSCFICCPQQISTCGMSGGHGHATS